MPFCDYWVSCLLFAGAGVANDCDGCHTDCTTDNGCGDGHQCGTEQCDDGVPCLFPFSSILVLWSPSLFPCSLPSCGMCMFGHVGMPCLFVL